MMLVNAYGQMVGGGPEPWQLGAVRRLADAGRTMRYCDVCGKPMPARRRGQPALYCSFPCQQEAKRYRARQRKRRER